MAGAFQHREEASRNRYGHGWAGAKWTATNPVSSVLCIPAPDAGVTWRSLMTFGRTSPETLPKEFAELRELMRSQPDR